MKLDPAAIPASIINRALAHEESLRSRLGAHAGAVFKVVSGPVSAGFHIDADGRLAQAGQEVDQPASLVLTVRPADIPALLHDPSRFDERVHADGDAALATTLRDLATTIPWFVERLLGNAFGSIVGLRLADAGRGLLGIPGHAATSLRANLGGYVRDEANVVAGRGDIDQFGDNVEDLAARADVLEARIRRIVTYRR